MLTATNGRSRCHSRLAQAVVDPFGVGSGAFNTVMSVGFDDAGRVLVAYVKYDAAGLTQLYLARHDAAGRWAIVQASPPAHGTGVPVQRRADKGGWIRHPNVGQVKAGG